MRHRSGDINPIEVSKSYLKPGDLIDQSGRVANALEADGWTWRGRIVWAKPNPMPESTDDRPTRSHEFFLFFAKATANTYWTHRDGRGARTQPEPDYRWVREDEELLAPPPVWQSWYDDPEDKRPEKAVGWRRINLWTGHRYYYDADAVREKNQLGDSGWAKMLLDGKALIRATDGKHAPERRDIAKRDREGADAARDARSGRNLRDVWTIPTHSFPEAHFATFPPSLVERPIKAGTSERGCCATCGAPWERVVSMSYEVDHEIRRERPALQDASGPRGGRDDTFVGSKRSSTLGWQPTCEHFSDHCAKCAKPWREVEVRRAVNSMNIRVRDAKKGILDAKHIDWKATEEEIAAYGPEGTRTETTKVRLPACFCGLVPCTVLDPFAGSGTVGVVALELGRRFVGIEANPLYVRMAQKRIAESRESAHPVAVVAVGLEEFG